MQQTYHTAQGDRMPIATQLTTNGNPVDLDGRDVSAIVRHEDGTKVVDALATVVNASTGYVSYTLTPTETAKAGTYDVEWVVSGGTNDPTTFPPEAPQTLVIRVDVEQADAAVTELPPDGTVNTLYATELNGDVTANQPVTTLAGAGLAIGAGALDVDLTGFAVDAETLDGIDSTQFARTDQAETFGFDVTLSDGAFQLGDGSTETFAESTSPTSWEFTPTLDIHQQTDLDITNGSGSSVTEDVTVDLYEGVDTTGTLLLSETRSITVAASTTVTETFIATDETLAETTHHIEISTSGTTLAIDSATETVDEQDWRWDRLADGTYQLTDARTATAVMEIDPLTGNTDLAGNQIRSVGSIWSDDAGGGQLRFDGAADAAFQTSGSGTGNNVIYDLANNQPIAKFHEGGLVEIPNGDLTDGVNTIYDTVNNHVPAARVEQGAGSGLDADTRDGLERYEELQQSPNDGIKFSDIPAGDYVAQPVYIPANQTLTVYMWGARTDGQATPAGLTVELFDETGAVSVASESTPRTAGNPVTSLSAGGTASDATLRLDNATGGALTAGAQFGYDIS